jgi:uncharacterized protein (TIGR00725 family)
MMRATAEGAKAADGQTVGILPGTDKAAANEFIDIAIPTDLGAYRNALLVRSCDAVIAIHGEYGTLSEIAFALRLGTPVVGLHTWEVPPQWRTRSRHPRCPVRRGGRCDGDLVDALKMR